MAILNKLKADEYNEVQNIIDEVLNDRKFRFDLDTIFEIIKKKALEKKINGTFLECSYFYILVLNTLDRMVDEGKIYQMRNYYVPADFIIFVDYFPTPTRLLYYVSNVTYEENLVDITNLKSITYDSINNSDFILCGGCSDLVDSEYREILQTNVSLEEISHLYYELIKEGASKNEALLLILNHYRIQVMPHNLKFIDEFNFQKPQIKKLSKKIIHNSSG